MSGSEELNALFHRIPVALYRSAPDGRLLAGNEALANLLGYVTVDEMEAGLRKVESVYVYPGDRQRWLDEMATNDIVVEFDVEFERPDGSRVWVQDTARTIRGDSGEILFFEGALIDVTEKVKAQRARDEFLATVSHELRNPITVMLGLGNELAVNYERFDDSDRRDMANLIARQADDAAWLIEDLLVAYKDDLDKILVVREVFELAKEVERVLEVIDQPIGLSISGPSSWVAADPRRCRQIVRNLVTNAVRYGGTKIWIELESRAETVCLKVNDNGGPIPSRDLERIFEPFERGSHTPNPTSVGLGLAVGRRLAHLMGGDLRVEAGDPVTSFCLTLPAA